MYCNNNHHHLQPKGWISAGNMYYYGKMFLKSFFTVNNTDVSSVVKACVGSSAPPVDKNGHCMILKESCTNSEIIAVSLTH